MAFKQNPEQFGRVNSVTEQEKKRAPVRRKGTPESPEAGAGKELTEPGE